MSKHQIACFISYCHHDKMGEEWHTYLEKTLSDRGLDIIRDSSSAGNKLLKDTPLDNVLKANYVFVLCTPEYLRASFVPDSDTNSSVLTAELAQAIPSRRIIPLLLEGTEPTSVPPFLSNRIVHDFRPLSSTGRFTELIERILSNNEPISTSKLAPHLDDSLKEQRASGMMLELAGDSTAATSINSEDESIQSVFLTLADQLAIVMDYRDSSLAFEDHAIRFWPALGRLHSFLGLNLRIDEVIAAADLMRVQFNKFPVTPQALAALETVFREASSIDSPTSDQVDHWLDVLEQSGVDCLFPDSVAEVSERSDTSGITGPGHSQSNSPEDPDLESDDEEQFDALIETIWKRRIEDSCRTKGLPYPRFIRGLEAAGIQADNKILSDLAVNDPSAFSSILSRAIAALKTQSKRHSAPGKINAARVKAPDNVYPTSNSSGIIYIAAKKSETLVIIRGQAGKHLGGSSSSRLGYTGRAKAGAEVAWRVFKTACRRAIRNGLEEAVVHVRGPRINHFPSSAIEEFGREYNLKISAIHRGSVPKDQKKREEGAPRKNAD